MSEIKADRAGTDGRVEDIVHFEVEIEEKIEVLVFPAQGEGSHADLIRQHFAAGEELILFERDREEVFVHAEAGRKHVRVVGHKCHEVKLEVRYDHETKPHHFRPAATVGKALQWAVGKHAYDLDPVAAAKANLILPGAESPLPKEDVLGKYIKAGDCTLVVDLTLKDFSNG
jgi:hypothetical protein